MAVSLARAARAAGRHALACEVVTLCRNRHMPCFKAVSCVVLWPVFALDVLYARMLR